jgi:hypothetical protein
LNLRTAPGSGSTRPYDIIVIGMIQRQDAGNPMTGRPYPVPDIRAISRSITYGALIDPTR